MRRAAGDRPHHTDAPSTKVLVLTMFGQDEVSSRRCRAWAQGFLLKDMKLEDLLAAVLAVAAW